MDEVKVVITLRSGKEVEEPLPKPTEKGTEEKEDELKKIVIKEDVVKKSTPPPPFPQALKSKKKAINQAEILEVLRQVKVNIPLLDMIDLCHGRVIGINNICFLCSSYYRSQATTVMRSRVEHGDGFSSHE